MPGRETQLPAAFDLKLILEEGADFVSVTVAQGLHFGYNGREAVLSFDQPRDENGKFAGIGRGRTVRKALLSDLKELRILADTSLVEIYLNRGETVFTTRYYPEGETRSLKAEGNIRETACWEMTGMQVHYPAGTPG